MEFLDFQLLKLNEEITITVRSVIFILVGLIIARIINYMFRRILKAYFVKREIDIGRSYTIITLVKYIVYIVAFLIIINSVGIKLTYLLAGSAALLVGIGLGLQNTFNDFFSGLILLVDGSISVGDVLLIKGTPYRVKYIGIRTSRLEDIKNHTIIIPNSHLVNNQIDNLSDNSTPIRYSIELGVSYKSDIKHVEQVLFEVIKPFNKYKMNYLPSVFLTGYGDSSINFKLNFFTEESIGIEKVLSDIRKEIFQAFEREGIEIPFPQRDIWLKSEVKIDKNPPSQTIE